MGGGMPQPEWLTVVFPPLSSLTHEPSVTVRGVADPSKVQAVTVSGVAASSTDSFANWTAVLPLSLGDNALTIDVVDGMGQDMLGVVSGNVERVSNPIANTTAMGLDQAGGRVFIDGFALGHGTVGPWPYAVVEVDLATGARSIVSSYFVGSGPILSLAEGIAWDAAGSRILFLDASDELFAIDPTTGDRTEITASPCNIGNGQDMDLDVAGGRVIVADYSDAVAAIDLTSGACSVVSSNSVGTGPALDTVRAIDLDPAQNRAFIANGITTDEILAVNLQTGNRTVISSSTVGTGPAFGTVFALTFDPVGNRLFAADRLYGLLSVNVANGNRTIVSGSNPLFPVGTGPLLDRNFAVVYDATTARPILAHMDSDELIAVDVPTGNRTVVSGFGIGSGPNMIAAADGAWDPTGERLIAVEYATLSAIAIDPDTSARSFLSGPSLGSGPPVGREVVAMNPVVPELVTAHLGTNFVAIDLQTADRTTVTDISSSGPLIHIPVAMVFDDNGQTIYAANGTTEIVAIDRATGNRTMVSDAVTGTGPALGFALALLFDGTDLFVVSGDHVMRVDPTTGNRTILSSTSVGTGPLVGILTGTFNIARDTIYTIGGDTSVAIDAITGDRTLYSLGLGDGPLFHPTRSTTGAYDVIWMIDPELGAALALDPMSGERVIASK